MGVTRLDRSSKIAPIATSEPLSERSARDTAADASKKASRGSETAPAASRGTHFGEGSLTLDAADAKAIVAFATRSARGAPMANVPLERMAGLSPDLSAAITNAVADFATTHHGGTCRVHRVPAMDEAYVVAGRLTGRADATVGGVHTDGNVPNLTAMRCYRMLICVDAGGIEAETVLLRRGGRRAVRLERLGQYLVFDYNGARHFVRQGAARPTGPRVLLKCHFVVAPAATSPRALRWYVSALVADNRATRAAMDRGGVVYSWLSGLKSRVLTSL
mmetsp:Transcript_11910/g.35507  ORF Transcript_11910/g.35507 Transcript_11910/m.35507 type:complete len:276 (-) Transcript_11910:37-864(-)